MNGKDTAADDAASRLDRRSFAFHGVLQKSMNKVIAGLAPPLLLPAVNYGLVLRNGEDALYVVLDLECTPRCDRIDEHS
jgi:hypothetical protein